MVHLEKQKKILPYTFIATVLLILFLGCVLLFSRFLSRFSATGFQKPISSVHTSPVSDELREDFSSTQLPQSESPLKTVEDETLNHTNYKYETEISVKNNSHQSSETQHEQPSVSAEINGQNYNIPSGDEVKVFNSRDTSDAKLQIESRSDELLNTDIDIRINAFSGLKGGAR